MILVAKAADKLRKVKKGRLFVRCLIFGLVAGIFLCPNPTPIGPGKAVALQCLGQGCQGAPEMPVLWVPVLMLASVACLGKIRKALA